MTEEEAYQLALKIHLAGERGEPIPQVSEDQRATAQRLWENARKRAGLSRRPE